MKYDAPTRRLLAGRHKGRRIGAGHAQPDGGVPSDYLRWLLRANETLPPQLVVDILCELHRRHAEALSGYGLGGLLAPIPDDWRPEKRPRAGLY